MHWQVILWSGEVTLQERQDFESWLQADAAHQQAWEALQQACVPLKQVPPAIASQALRAAPANNQRRKLLLGLSLLCGSLAGARLLQQTPQWQTARADYRTPRGETRRFTLPDGTQLTLNTDSAVDLAFSGDTRTLHLLQGEILISTAADPATIPRPFIVSSPCGEIRPIGTRFSVRRLEDASGSVQVQVFEGAVELSPRSGPGSRLEAGQQARFDQHGSTRPLPASPSSVAWEKGLLVAEQQRLEDFLGELGRYRTGVLRCTPEVADLRVSGVYPLADTDVVLQALEQALPVRIKRLTRYWVTLSARG
ncbi:FecR domain-containing protein [Pseudomonas sp. LRF_L74]|uniref:FecR domain-containing protein n=1 Tax=Pseudomonas sp. LRF_L74 TaxID=3369422 RepID=UPI003F5DCB7B